MTGRKRMPSEHEEQVALFEWWRLYTATWRSLRPAMFAIPNGGARDAVTGARLKAEGVLPGVPDIFLAAPKGSCHGLFIEMKRRRGGRISPAQLRTMQELEADGYRCEVAYGWDHARRIITEYLG